MEKKYFLKIASEEESNARDELMRTTWGEDFSVDEWNDFVSALRAIPYFDKGYNYSWFLFEHDKDDYNILASLETHKFPSKYVEKDSSVNIKDGNSYVIGEVFVEEKHRGHNYARILIQLVIEQLLATDPTCQSFVLHSELEPKFYHSFLFQELPSMEYIIFPQDRPFHTQPLPQLTFEHLRIKWDSIVSFYDQQEPKEGCEMIYVPTMDHLDYEWEMERVKRRQQNKNVPEFSCGVMEGNSVFLWSADYYYTNSLRSLYSVFDNSNINTAIRILQEASYHAKDLGLDGVVIWEDGLHDKFWEMLKDAQGVPFKWLKRKRREEISMARCMVNSSNVRFGKGLQFFLWL